MADSQTTKIWVLAYILRFPNEPGEWAQVCHFGYPTEKQAYAALEATGNPSAYSVCKVEIANHEQP